MIYYGHTRKVQQLLVTVPGVDTVEPAATSTAKDSRYRFQVKAGKTDPGEAIAAAIVRAGFGLCELRRHHASREDVFLNLTTEEPTDSPPLTEAPLASSADQDADGLNTPEAAAPSSLSTTTDSAATPETDGSSLQA